jgi:hypothetical protein
VYEPGECSQYSDWLRTGRPRGRSTCPGRVKNFLFSTSSRLALGSTQPAIQWVPGALSPGVKRPGREADHSPSACAEVNKMWIYTSTPPYAFMGQLHLLPCRLKHFLGGGLRLVRCPLSGTYIITSAQTSSAAKADSALHQSAPVTNRKTPEDCTKIPK